MLDDLSTGYIADTSTLFKAVKGNDLDKKIFNQACNFVGLLLEDKKKLNFYKKINIKISENEILDKIRERNKARKNKNFELADKIRNELSKKGILIEDKDDKTLWKYK